MFFKHVVLYISYFINAIDSVPINDLDAYIVHARTLKAAFLITGVEPESKKAVASINVLILCSIPCTWSWGIPTVRQVEILFVLRPYNPEN